MSPIPVPSPLGDLHLYARRESGVFTVGKRIGGKWVRACLKTNDLELAKSRAFTWIQDKAFQKNPWGAASDKDADKLVRKAYLRAKKRAAKDGMRFSLDYKAIQRLAIDSRYRCAVSGIGFSAVKKGSFRAPFTPSIDRIDSNMDYVPENVRLVCAAVNWALSDWGDEVFLLICHGAIQRATINKLSSLKQSE